MLLRGVLAKLLNLPRVTILIDQTDALFKLLLLLTCLQVVNDGQGEGFIVVEVLLLI